MKEMSVFQMYAWFLPFCAGDHVQLNFGAVPCSLSSFNTTTEIPGLDPGVWGLILSPSGVCCWTEPRQGMQDAQWCMVLITDLWGRDFLGGFETSWRLFPVVIRDKEGEVCPYLCPEPLMTTQAALQVTLVGTVGLCPRKASAKGCLRKFSRKLI